MNREGIIAWVACAVVMLLIVLALTVGATIGH